MSTELSGVFARDLTDTGGALHILNQRSGQTYSPDTIHYLVRQRTLPAYVFYNAELVRWEPGKNRRGQVLIFLKRDVYNLTSSGKKRGRRAKNEFSDVAKISPLNT